MAHQSRGWANYTASNTGQYGTICAIKCDFQTVANNASALTPAPSNNNYWPAHRSDMRAVYGADTTGRYKDICIAFLQTGSLYALGSTFADAGGNTYKTNGLRSERFRIRNLK